MLMASQVAQYIIAVMAKYGDVPCILEKKDGDGIPFEPLGDIPVMTIYRSGSKHTESCLLFTRKSVIDRDD